MNDFDFPAKRVEQSEQPAKKKRNKLVKKVKKSWPFIVIVATCVASCEKVLNWGFEREDTFKPMARAIYRTTKALFGPVKSQTPIVNEPKIVQDKPDIRNQEILPDDQIVDESEKYLFRYSIRKGDQIGIIIRKHGMTVTELRQLNPNLPRNLNKIIVGTVITLRPWVLHTVKSNETLSKIAFRYGVPYKRIMGANKLTSTGLEVGQELIIPRPLRKKIYSRRR